MSITIQFIPRAKIDGIPIIDLNTGEKSWTTIENLFGELETIEITYNPTSSNSKELIRSEIRQSIIDKLDEVKSKGLKVYQTELDLSGSAPVIIETELGTADFVDNKYGEWGGVKAEYAVIRTGNTSTSSLIWTPLDRIFLSAPPSMKYDTCEYFQPDPNKLLTFEWEGKVVEASCGFQYFYQTFCDDRNYATYVRQGKNKSKYNTKNSFERIKYWISNPPKKQYDDWLVLYRDWMKKKNLDACMVKPVEDDIIAQISDIPEINVIDLSPPNYSELEKYNSMTIDDIVRLCMCMNLSLLVFDEFGELMLSYDKNNEYHNNNKTKGGRVVVKVVNNHGYFIKKGDPILLKFSSGGFHNWGGFYPNNFVDNFTAEAGRFSKSDGIEIGCSDAVIIRHPKAIFRQKDLTYEFYGLGSNPTHEDFEKIKREQEAPYLKKTPPPTPQELIGMMKTGGIYYVGNTNLNGLVNYLQKNTPLTCSIQVGEKQGFWKIVKSEIKKGETPNNIRGLTTSIHKASYGKLRLLAYHQHPTTGYKLPDDYDGDLVGEELEKECLDKWKQDYPVLTLYSIPTPSAIGMEILDEFKIDCYSRMNSKVRDIFFEGETKPDFRATKPTHNFACAFSLDFSKAYSNAAKFMDTEWSVFDAIDEPRPFREGLEFVDSAFYLCQELETGFPYKDLKDKGLALYHGCLLRHLQGKVKPIYIINSHKKLPANSFVGFVDKCYELAGDGKSNIVSGKQLVNNTFGNLKRKGGIKDYRLYLNSGKNQLFTSFSQGFPVHKLQKGMSWRGSNFITARGNYQHHFTTGQPIRLQIMDRINELNLLLDKAVRTSLNRDIHLLLVKTDALYYQYPDGAKYNFQEYYWRKFKFDPVRDIDLQDINSKLPEGYEVKLERPKDSGLGSERPVEITDTWSSAPEKLNQEPIFYKTPIWKDTKTKKEWWDKNEIPELVDKYYKLGGLYCRGEGGVGKTEFIKGIDEICKKNRDELETMTKELKDRDDKEQIIKEWRETHPCFVFKLAPTNKACNNIGGRTLHRGLGLRVCKSIDDDDGSDSDDEDEDNSDRVGRLIKKLKEKPPDIIPVDEISMIGGEGWSILSYIKFRIPSIKFFLFGDIKRQLPPVGEEKRIFENSVCMKELANYNKLELKYNFRRNTADTDSLWDKVCNHPETFVRREAPLTYRNLCWTNKTRKEVIDLVQNSHPNPEVWLDCGLRNDTKNTGQNERLMLAVGVPLIARKSIKDREVAKNEIWEVKSITGEQVVLGYKDKEETFDFNEIRKKWLSAYCITIHKSQGDTYRDEYTIWDWDRICEEKSLYYKRLRYVAVSRSTDYERLVYYK